MQKSIFLLFLFLSGGILLLNAQAKKDVFEGEEVRLKKEYLKNEETAFFYVKNVDKKVKHGKYWVKEKSSGTLIEGAYKNGIKSGVWSYFENEEVLQKYDYDKGTLAFVKPARKNQTFEVFQDGNFEKSNLDYEANILGGKRVLQKIIMKRLKMPLLEAYTDNAKLVYLIKITVDTKGKVEALELDEIIGHPEMTEALEKAIQPISNLNFYSGQKDGENVKTKTLVPIDVDIKKATIDLRGPVYKSSN